MGALLGLVLGVGLLLIWRSGPRRVEPRGPRRPTASQRTADMLAQAGLPGITPASLAASCAGVAVVALVVMLLVSRSLTIAVAFGVMGAYLPVALVRLRRRQRLAELREMWPEVVDNLASGVRAGLSLPEALTQIAVGSMTTTKAAEPLAVYRR